MGIISEFAPERGDVHVHGTVIPAEFAAHGKLKQVLAGEDPSRMGRHAEQDAEFQRGEIHRDAVHARLHGLAVHPQSAHPDHAVLFGLLPLRLHGLRPPEHGPHPRQQLARGKGFGHIVVRAHLKPHNPAGFLILRGEDDNGRGADFPQAPQHVKAVHIRQHHIEQDHVVFVRNGFFQPGRSVLGNVEREPKSFKVVPQQPAQLGVVIDEERGNLRMFDGGHASSFGWGSRWAGTYWGIPSQGIFQMRRADIRARCHTGSFFFYLYK